MDGDKVRVAQIVSNLLINAAKYTPSGGRIEVKIAREGQQAVISVRDNGVGIPPEMLTKVFEMFTQVDGSNTRAQGGLGIGLTLVKTLVEMHGGTIIARRSRDRIWQPIRGSSAARQTGHFDQAGRSHRSSAGQGLTCLSYFDRGR